MIKAFCTSLKCDPTQKSAKGTIKESVKNGQSFCPDCGNAVFWAKVGRKYRPGMSFNGKMYKERKRDFDLNLSH